MKLRYIAAAVTSLALASGTLAQEKPTDAQALSYLFGYEFGANNVRALQQKGENVDLEWLIKGLREGAQGATVSVPQEQRQQVVKDWQQREEERRQQAAAEWEQIKQQNRQKSDEFLAANARQPGVKELQPGIQYRVITAGKGRKPSTRDKVKLKVKGPFPFGERHEAEAAEHSPVVGNIELKGLATAITHMKVGSAWEIWLAPEQAFGDDFRAPNTAVMFELTLVAIE